MPTYLWKDQDRPALGDMDASTVLGDGSIGDTSTAETAFSTLSFGAGCGFHEHIKHGTAVCVLGGSAEVLTWRFTAKLALDNGDNIVCALPWLTLEDEEPIDLSDHLEYWIEVSNDAGAASWTPIQSGEVASYHTYQTVSGTFAADLDARYVRCVLRSVHRFFDQNDTITSEIFCSDFRVTYQDLVEDDEEEASPDTYSLGDETQILVFDQDGDRVRLPQHRIISASYVISNTGGYEDFQLQVACSPSELTGLQHGHKVQVWVSGLCRYEGYLSEFTRSLSAPDVLNVSGYGLWRAVKDIQTDRMYVRTSDTDLGEIIAQICSDYVIPLYPNLEVEIDNFDFTVQTLDGRNRTVGDLFDTALKIATSRAVFGIDRNPATGAARLYLRKIDTTTPDHIIYQRSQRKYAVTVLDSREDTGDLVNRLRILGSSPKFPNLLTNSSFEQLKTSSLSEDSNLLFLPSFEASDSLNDAFWDREGGADYKTGGLSEGNAFSGRSMMETDGSGEAFSQTLNVGSAKPGHTYVFGAYVKRESSAVSSTGEITLDWLDTDDNVIDTESLTVDPDSVIWEEFTKACVCPATAKSLRLPCDRHRLENPLREDHW